MTPGPPSRLRVDGSDDYGELHDAVARVLPVTADGTRRPPDREALPTYLEVGRLLNEHLSGRAVYGKRAIARLAADLGLAPRTLYRARKVHERLPADASSLATLTWSHCRLLVTIDDAERRRRLTSRVVAAGWSVRRLQEHLSTSPSTFSPPPLQAGTYRIIVITDAAGTEVPAFDLGFGIRRPLVLPGKPGKKTRRLLRELVPGDTVESTTDDKGRPALRRVWGQVESRLYVNVARHLRVCSAGTLVLQLDLGFDVVHECRAVLQPPAQQLSRTTLEAAVVSQPLPVLVRSVRLPRRRGYAVDLYHLKDHLNSLWAGTEVRS